ncbi:tenascin-X [Natator depressus]|uniref:tenascin-X n=1 Tax=Natator depressus TaxID=27790 RepID=UPI003EB8A50F
MQLWPAALGSQRRILPLPPQRSAGQAAPDPNPGPGVPPGPVLPRHLPPDRGIRRGAGEGAGGAGPESPQEALAPPSQQQPPRLYEHTLEGDEQVVFTHRINLPPPACDCEGRGDGGALREALSRLRALEAQVQALREQCGAKGCCPSSATAQAGTGQTDTQSLCSRHGTFDLATCGCVCQPGWGGPTCAEPQCPGGCGGRGECRAGRCACPPGFTGARCETPVCADDCNDQGRCQGGRCVCFPGYSGPACETPDCPGDCRGRGRCQGGRCVCRPGYAGPDCGTRGCPGDCRGRGRCLKSGVCACHPGYAGPDCSQPACPGDCGGHGECRLGECHCQEGYAGEDCTIEIPAVTLRVGRRDEGSFRLQWTRPKSHVDGYEIHLVPTGDPEGAESLQLPGSATSFERSGLGPGREFSVTVRAQRAQRLGPPATQSVRTRIDAPRDLRPTGATATSLSLRWEPPAARPDGYTLHYGPAGRDSTEPPTRLALPPDRTALTLTGLRSTTQYTLTLTAHRGPEQSPPASINASTAPMPTLPPPGRPHPEPTRPPVPRLRPPGPVGKPGPRPAPANASSVPSPLFFRTMTQNLTAKLSRYNGTLLQRLESYLRATRYPLRGNQTIATAARAIYHYLVQRKSLEEQEMVYVGLGQHSKELGAMAPPQGHPMEQPTGPPGRFQIAGEGGSIFSAGSPGSEAGPRGHAKPAVVARSPGTIVVSLEGMRGHAERVVVRHWRAGDGGGAGELAVPGDAAAVRLQGLAPGTTYRVEIHGLVQGRLSKSYSFVASTAPEASGTEQPPETSMPSLSRPGRPPGDLAVTDVSPDRFRVTWTATTGPFQHFLLRYREPGSVVPPGQTQVPGGKRSVIVTQLSPGTEYEVELRGVAPDGTISEPITTSVWTARLGGGPGPNELGVLGVRNVTSDGFGLQWRARKGLFQSFLLRYEDAAGRMGPREAEVPGDQRATRVGGLQPGTEYNVTLYGVHRGQLSPPLRARVRTAPSEPAPQPSLGELSASSVTHDSALLSWTVQSGTFDSFLLQYKDAEGKPQALPVDGGSRTVTVAKLAPSRRYKFNLYGISGRKRLGPVSTDAVTAAVPREEEPAPQPSLGELSASGVTHDSALLSWTIQAGDFDSFLLQYKDAEGNPQVLPVDGGSRTVTVANLAPSRRYKFNLYGISGRKRLGPISTDTVTAAAPREEEPASEPSLGELSASDITHDSTLLSWTVQAGDFDSFLLQYKDAEGKPQALPVDGGSRTVTVANLAPSRRYKFNLYGISGRKRLGPVSTDAVTAAAPREEEPASEPSLGELSASDITHDSTLLSWTVQAGDFDSFLLQYKDAEGKPQALPVDGGSRTVTVANLAPSRRYKFKLYGISGRKRLGPVSTDTVTAAEPREEEPAPQPSLGELSASDVTHDSALLSWTVQAGTFDSFLLQYKDAEGKPQALPVDGGSRIVTLANLAPSRRYKFNLYGISGRKRLGPVSTDAVTAAAPREEKPAPQPSLGELSASDVTHDSALLSWTVQAGDFDSFLLQYKDAEGKPQALPVDGGSRTVTVADLAPSRRYKFNLYGISGRKRLGPVSTDAVTATAPQEEEPAPQPSLGELSASDVTHDSALLSWTVEEGTFDSFLLQYKDAEGKPQALPVDGGSRTVTVTNLAPSRRYKFNLYGISGRKRLGPVSTDAVTAAAPREEEPAPRPSLGELSASDVTHDSALLSWTVQAGDFDSFLLQYKDAEGKPQALPVDGGSRTVTVADLAPSRRYKFNLYGISGRKRLGPVSTDTVTAAVPRKEEPAPQPSLGELSASGVTHDSALLSWTVQAGDFDSFLLQYKDAEGKPQALPVDGGSRTVTVADLAPSRRYKFNLYGISGRKRLGPVSTDAVTGQQLDPAAAPREEEPAPQPSLGELSASDVTHDSALLSWTVQAGDFDSFLLQYKDAEGNPQALPVDGGSRTVTVANLAPSRRYKFNLYGISGRKRLGPVSTDAVTATAPREEEPAPKPSLGELSASNVTHDSALLSWTIQSGTFDSFLLQYKDAEGKPQALPVDGGSRMVTVSNLAPSRRYKFNLYGISSRKRLGPVSTDTVTAPREEEPAPQPSLGELSASGLTHDSILLSWTVQAGDFASFLLQYKDAEGNPQVLPVDGGSRTVTVTNLAPSRRYKFNLYGISGRKRLGPVSTDAVTAVTGEEEPAPQPSLGELLTSDVTHNSILLSWTVEGTFDSFLLQYKDVEGKPQALPVDGGSRTVTVANLAPSRRYKFNLYGISGRKRLGPVSTDAVTAAAPREEEPASELSLGELSASDVTHDSALLSWTVQAGDFDSFLLQYKDAEGNPQVLPVDGGSRTVTVANLAPSRRYKFNLYGISGRKRLGPVSTDTVTAAAPREEEPAPQPSLGELSASDVTHDSALLSWTVQAGDFDSFLLQYKDAEGNPQALPVDGGSRTVTVANLAPSRRYKFNLYGISGRKRLGPVSTDAVTAMAPREEGVGTQLRLGELSVANAAHNSLDLSWTVEEGTFDSFILQYRDAEGNPRALPVDGALRSLHLHDLAPSRRYKFNLYGVSGRKRLGPVSTDAVTAAVPQEEEPAPQPSLGELSASNVTHDSALLSWTIQAGTFDSFILQYKDAEGKPQALPVDGGSRTVTVANLAPSRRYKFNLYGISGRKRLGPVSTDAVTAAAPREEEPAPQPSLGELSASDVTHDSALLSWTVQAGDFDSFLLQYKDAEGKPQVLPVDGGSRTVTVANLAPSRRYKFNLYGISGRKRLGPVSTDAVTAAAPREEEPAPQPSLGELSASNVTHDSIPLSWTVEEGTFDSFLLQYKDAKGKPQALPLDGGSRTVTVANLAPSRRYKFNLYGISGRKRLGPVSTDAVTAAVPREEKPAPQPSLGELSASDVTHDSALLSWTVQAGDFDSFLLQYKDAEGKPQALPVDGESRTVTVANLAPSRRYKFNLYGISGRKRLGPVSTDAVTAAAPREEESAPQPSLGELSASDVTHDSALLSWTVQAGTFDSFLLQYKDAEGKPQALPVDGESRTVTVANLAPSRRYKFNLYGISGRKRLGPVSTDTVTAAAPREEEPAPQPSLGELSASDVTHDSALLSWTVEEGTFDSFLLQYKDAEGKPQALPVDGGSRTVTVANLAPSRRYKFNLYGISGRKRLGPVSTDAVTAAGPRKEEPAPPASLGELSASDITHDSALLSWTIQAGDFDSFLLQYKDAEGNPQALPVDGGSRTVTVTNLAPSRRYKFNLYGISGRKRLGPVSTDAVTAPREEEPAPQPSLGELSASNVTHDSALLSWTVQAGDFDSFLLQYKDAEGNPQALPMDGGSRTVTLANLAPSRRYKFNLYSISGRKRLGPVSTDAVTAAAPREEEPAPQPSLGELSASDVTHDSALLSWTVEGTFDSFLLQYKDTEGKPQALPADGASRMVTITNLAPSRRYKFNLYGISGRKRLGPVSTDAVTAAVPREEEPAPQPSLGELSASNVTHDSALLSWTVQAGDFDSFLLQYKDAEGNPQALPVDGGSRTVTVANLAPSRRYKFNLYGISGRKRLGPVSTDAVTAAVPGEEEPAPQPSLGELSASDVTHDSALLSWTVQAGDFDSFLLQYKDAEGKPQALPVDGGSRTVTVADLAPSRRYKFNLYGISGRKRLGPVSTDAITAAAPREEEPAPQPSLGELSASDVTHDSALLSWTIQARDFDSFLLQYKDAEGKPQALPVDGGSRTVTVADLAPSHRYKFNLYGISGRKRLGPVSTDAVTAAAPREEEPAPRPSLGELSASGVTHDSALLSWTVQAGDFDSFLLQYRDAEGKPQALPVDGGSRTVTVANLAPSRRYKFNLYGISGRKRLGPVSTDAVTAAAPQEEEPAPQPSLGELSASGLTHDSALLSWTVQAGDFASFLLQYKDAEGKPQALPVDGGSRTVTVANLAPSHRYKFNLYGISGRKRLGPVSTDAVTAPREEGARIRLRLGQLSASDITHDSLDLSWTVEEGTFDSFILQYRDAEGNPQALPVDGGSRTVTVANLAPSRRYKFNLYGISGRKRLGPVSTDAVTGRQEEEDEEEEEEGASQPKLGELSTSEVTKDSVRLSWTVQAGAFDAFLLQYRDAEGKPQALPADGASRTLVVSDLLPSRKYKFNLYGVSGPKRLGPVSTDAVTAFPEASSVTPARLDQLLISEVTPTSLRLSWDVPEGDFDTFLIRYRDAGWGPGLGPAPAQEVPVPGAQRSAVLRGLQPSTEYGLAVYGLRQGEETANVHGAAQTSSLELESPRDLHFSDVRETSVGVTWGAPSTHVDRYKVSFQLSEGGEPQSVMVAGTRLQTTLEGLIPGASYEVSVMAVRGFEESEPLVGYVTTVPDGPSDLRAINVTEASALLRWRPPRAPVQSYELSYGPPEGPAVTVRLPGARAEHPLTGLRLDTEYLVSVHGVTGGNRSSPARATFTTGLDAPRDLQATDVTPRSARLSWTPPRVPPAGYLLSYETPSGQTQEIPLGSDAASYQLSNLSPSSRYQVQVQAIRGGLPSTPIATSFNTVWLTHPFPRDCVEEQLNGPGPSREVTIYLGGDRQRPLQVYCDMETDGGGWLVFQRRMDGETDFWRDWQEYAQGFGNRSREFWLGNDALHQLTAAGEQELRVDLRAGAEAAYARYQRFRVDPPSEHYRLHLDGYRGTAGDALSYHSGSVFSTRDRDPNRLLIPCAVSYRGAWWYRNCHYANLNGLYGSGRDHQGVNWFNWKGFEFSIPFTEMKLRPRRG